MKYTCIIPSTGRKTLHDRALKSIFNQKRRFNQVIVIYDLPKDHFVLYANDVEVMFTGGNVGGPAARKLAYTKAIGTYVVLLDDDDELANDFLENLDYHLRQSPRRPCLVMPRINKIWPEGNIPAVRLRKFRYSDNGGEYDDLSSKDWLPTTSSGLVVSRIHFPELPVSSDMSGFNDVQICHAAKKSVAPIFYFENCVVKFYQYFSIDRLTSNLPSRVNNLNIAVQNGLKFSDAQKSEILKSSALSQARSIAYRDGLIASVKDLMESFRLLNLSWKDGISARCGINGVVIVWLSLTRHIKVRAHSQ